VPTFPPARPQGHLHVDPWLGTPPAGSPARSLAAALTAGLAASLFVFSAQPAMADDDGPGPVASGCQLGGANHRVKHVVELQFDNVHLRRDDPKVPSDLEQMPNLLNFLQDNGALLTDHHTPLISHTADDIITTLTGVYPDKHGQPVANSYGYFKPDGTIGFSSSFVYWTDTAPNGTPQMIDPRGKTHPAPWVPFTRAGCDFGAFSTANIEFENTTTDVLNVFGAGSPEANEGTSSNSQTRAKAVTDLEGIAIHCAQGSPICGSVGKADLLPDEPGTYVGFNGLFGNIHVAPQITPDHSLTVRDLDGNPIADSNGNPGFPGFDPSASQTLGYVATMLEAGVPVVYAYIADAHDNHFSGVGAYGPGEAGFVAQLAAYNTAFGKFFARLQKDGITRENTVFIITADENDHFAGKPGTPADCDGVHIPCNYVRIPDGCDTTSTAPACTTTDLGEVNVDLRALLQTDYTTYVPPSFSVHSDDAPAVYIAGNPAPTAAVTRTLEHNLGGALDYDPIKNGNVPITKAMAGQAEMGLLHMITHDPARTPTFILFGDPDFFMTASTAAGPCTSLLVSPCSNEQPDFNWNHGDFQEQITRTWLGMVGPGVRAVGRTGAMFSDHTDVRPTLLSLAGLTDDYAHDGRVLFEVMESSALPESLRASSETLHRMASLYKAIDAPRGTLGRETLRLSTQGIMGSDATFSAGESKIAAITAKRDAIAAQMNALLEAAAFQNKPLSEDAAEQLIDEAQDLLDSVAHSDD
jgi:hypothetical protein